MTFLSLIHLKCMFFFEFVLQVAILYNIYQIFKQKNFYYVLAYFFNTVFFFGVILIFYDFDIVTVFLWIIYGSVTIVFFIYSLAWFDSYIEPTFSVKARFFTYFIVFTFIFFFFYFDVLDYNEDFLCLESMSDEYINYYDLLGLDTNEELEVLGWGLLYYTSFLFILISYFFFLNCCCVVLIIATTRQIKNRSIFTYFSFLKKTNLLENFNITKNQHFFMQEYEFINQNYTFTKNFKVTGKFHKIKIKRI